ncbi:hypothetical protein F4604DRAFT_1925758 [Suillus subluteus]|nr:hypothetical protein F4604DRAFT_1925758 [Suillus subluteus]
MAWSEVHSTHALQFPVASPLPLNRLYGDSSPSTPLPGGGAFVNSIQSPSDKGKQKARKPKQKPVKLSMFHLDKLPTPTLSKRGKKQESRPVYGDELEDEEEENVLDPVAVPSPGSSTKKVD